jgi:hypothetical protein
LVQDLAPSSALPQNLTNVNGTLYFTARTSSNGTELWKLETLDDQETSLSRDSQINAIANDTGNDILTGISSDEKFASDRSPDTLIGNTSSDRLYFDGIDDIDLEILNANTEFPIINGIQTNPSFGTGSLLANIFDTTGFTIEDIDVHPFSSEQLPIT